MEPQVKERLLASMEADRLVLLVGAGLSMAPPSSAPSAAALAAACFDEYTAMANPACDPAMRNNLEAFADYFFERHTLKTIFIDRLVPWVRFYSRPNVGHAAIADFLLTRAAAGALSSNYDVFIERQAWDYGAQFNASLDGDEANVHTAVHSPFLKFHGCAYRARGDTVWTRQQLAQPPISNRIASNTTWMAANLREKDLLVVGFWSDWSYFNDILGAALADVSPRSVTLVDPSPPADLEAKAPALWALAHQQGTTFAHIRESGASVLDELRREFSRGYLRRLLRAGIQQLELETNAPCDVAWLEVADTDSEDLYAQRRDAEGTPAIKPATQRRPINVELLGFFHLLLRRAAARQTAEGYELNGRKVRVINGAGAIMSTLRNRFVEAPLMASVDIVAAIGSTDLGLPGNVVRDGRAGDIIRPTTSAQWLDFQSARDLLGL